MTTTRVHTGRSQTVQAVLLAADHSGLCVFPFYWMVTTSLKTHVVALEAPPVWFFTPTLENYREALFEDGVFGTLINSIIIAICTTALALVLGVPAALRWRGSSFGARRTCGSGSSPTAWCRPSFWRCRSF